jgi:hypothetical protein
MSNSPALLSRVLILFDMKADRSFFLPKNQAPKRMPLFAYLANIPVEQQESEFTRLAKQGRIIEEDFLGNKFYYVIEEGA